MKLLELELKNFAHIERAEVELKPLTIFFGKNNTGKSYIATLLAGLFKDIRRLFRSSEGQLSEQEWIELSIPQSAELIMDIFKFDFYDVKHRGFTGLPELVIKLRVSQDAKRISDVVYLPPGRSAFMKLYKLIIGEALKRLTSEDNSSAVNLSDPTLDFLIKLATKIDPVEQGELRHLAEYLEIKVLGGEVIAFGEPIPDFGFIPSQRIEFGRNLLKMHVVSSLVNELTPLVLFLKHGVIRKNSFVVIEEPEAHLHPSAQKEMAKFIVRLVKAGTWVLITTHSNYMFYEFNNLIRLSQLDEDRRKVAMEKLGYAEEDVLNFQDVASYLFDLSPDGFVQVKRLRLDEDGISDENFLQTAESIYDEREFLEELLYEQKQGSSGQS